MRGSLDSRQHLWLDADSDIEFWNYTFEEIGTYDLKATIELIQKEKQSEEKIYLVNFSLGTTISMYALSTFPEWYD